MASSAFKAEAEDRLRNLELPPGYSWRWSGRFAEWDRAKTRLVQLGALTVVLIALLLWLQSHRLETVVLTLITLAPACSGRPMAELGPGTQVVRGPRGGAPTGPCGPRCGDGAPAPPPCIVMPEHK